MAQLGKSCNVFLMVVVFLVGISGRELEAQVPTGEYVLDSAQSDDINRAISAATADLNFIKRPIARRRLRAANPAPRTLSIKSVGDSVEVMINGTLGLRVKPGRTRDWRGFNGEALKVTSSLEHGVLTNTFVADDGEKRNTYRLRPDGMLELNVHLSSPRLKHPVEYTQIFRRS